MVPISITVVSAVEIIIAGFEYLSSATITSWFLLFVSGSGRILSTTNNCSGPAGQATEALVNGWTARSVSGMIGFFKLSERPHLPYATNNIDGA